LVFRWTDIFRKSAIRGTEFGQRWSWVSETTGCRGGH